jgi:hypothetical protein
MVEASPGVNHVLIAVTVGLVILVERVLRAALRRRLNARRLPPDQPLEEHLSSSGQFRAVVYPHDTGVMRIEVFRRTGPDPTEPSWLRISGPSFVDREALPAAVHEALRAAGGP